MKKFIQTFIYWIFLHFMTPAELETAIKKAKERK